MNENKSAIDTFFEGLPKEDKRPADIFNTNRPADVSEKSEGGEKADTSNSGEPHKNRRHRRLEEQLQSEREARLVAEERNKVLSEVDKFAKETGGQIDPRLIRAFGTTDEGKELARIFTDIRAEDREAAKREALKEVEAANVQRRKEEKDYENFITDELENLEDRFSVDLTSDAPAARKARRDFLEVVQNLSPKDEAGTITGFADFETSFDLYQKTKTESKQNNASNERRREISGASMQRPGGGSAENTAPKVTPGFRGWMKDMNLR